MINKRKFGRNNIISTGIFNKIKEAKAMAECLIHRSGYSAKQGVITVPITTLTVYGGSNTNTTSYEYNGNGVVTAKSSNTAVATVTVSNGKVVVTYVSPGSATITVTGSKTNKFKECSTTFDVTCARTSLTIPSLQNTSVGTTGNSVSPGVNNYNSNLITQTGTTSSSSIGTWTVYWNLKDTNRYCWSDGSLTQKSQSWSTYGGQITFHLYVSNNWDRSFTTNYGNRFCDVGHIFSNEEKSYYIYTSSSKQTFNVYHDWISYGSETEYLESALYKLKNNKSTDFPVNGGIYELYYVSKTTTII